MTDDEVLLHEAERLSRYIGGLLAGKDPMVQAAVLAELTAIWLHGHRTDTREATRKLRADLLAAHVQAVCQLVDLADEASA